MKIQISAVGRLRPGPERALVEDYATRLGKIGRAVGLGPARIVEVEDRKGGGPAAEGALLANSVPQGAVVCALDERGKQMSSTGFAQLLGGWRDTGRPCATFFIGGADGLDQQLCADSDIQLSLGPMVWPHMLVRVMLAEQLYRAASILAGTPYHRA